MLHSPINAAKAPTAVHKLQYSADEIIQQKTPVLFHNRMELQQQRHRLQNELGITFTNDFEVLVAKARRNIHEEQQ